MAVLQVTKYTVIPDKLEAYSNWTEAAIRRQLAVPGVVEFRAYRDYNSMQVILTYEFADFAGWTAWRSNKETEKLIGELQTLAVNITAELWGPSPVVPKPIRP